MESLFLLIPISAILVALAAAGLYWSARSGQFEQLDEAGRRPLDDESPQD